ncbi:putative glutamine synthetase [Luminiphilus syltensis NOR5-1B]|uniref:Putative glutamine synthetase n=1 Tax=Luminiphilus syltensis NOR5-1B TaxID=565045 RepID=B8KSK8_9GAMM|nr:glutamine synthetase family protein [Luminiphilus syltensis]EED34558.1 putative glutamine synthetase [Luminiphilus syltensis NOR5-1B]
MDREVELFLKAYPAVTMVEALITDCNGVARGKWIPKTKLNTVTRSGLKLPKSALALDIWGRDVPELAFENGDMDGYCMAVPGSLTPVLGPNGVNQAQLLMTMTDEEHAPFMGDPRQVLSGVIDRFRRMGLRPCVAVELEFSLLPDPGKEGLLSDTMASKHDVGGNLYALNELDRVEPMLDALRALFEVQGLPYEGIIKEAAPSQFEINMAHSAKTMQVADHIIKMQRGIRTIAKRFGLIASFMPKPMDNVPGNGMHVHCSLLDKRNNNIFNDGTDAGSQHLRHAVGGALDMMADSMLVFAPSYNAYRRFQPGNHAPTFPAWGMDNRTTAVRIPAGPHQAKRIEHRVAGADANPYLTLAVVLAGVLKGLDSQNEPPEPIAGNAYDQQPEGDTLPTLMGDAIDRFSSSEAIANFLSPQFQRIYALTKRQELAEFGSRVTEFELKTYLEI